MVALNIAYIGGGSRNWARTLMGDLAHVPDLCGKVKLYDIDFPAAYMNERLGNWIWASPNVQSRWDWQAVEKIEDALRGADLVIISIQPGSLELMEHEIAIAEKYGRYFPVGDSTGIPGLMRALRSAITYEGFAKMIAAYAPHAWVINYTNPMTVCTRTLTKVAPGLKVFGCCHEVFGTQKLLAKLAQKYLGLDHLPERDEILVNVMGINHFTWIDKAEYRGNDLLAILREHLRQPGVLRKYTSDELEAKNDLFFDAHQIKFALFQKYGLLPAAGDRHLSEFVPGFVNSPIELNRWGVMRTPVSYRKAVRKNRTQMVTDWLSGQKALELRRSGEEAVRQISALFGLGNLITNVNLENQGQIPNLPLHAVVETNARFSQNSVQPLAAGPLPPALYDLISRHVANQEAIIEAALRRDKDLAFQAVYDDPTTGMPVEEARKMFQEIGLPDGWGRSN